MIPFQADSGRTEKMGKLTHFIMVVTQFGQVLIYSLYNKEPLVYKANLFQLENVQAFVKLQDKPFPEMILNDKVLWSRV